MTIEAFRSRVLHVTSTHPLRWEYFEDGILLIEDGFISDLNHARVFEQAGFPLDSCRHYPRHLLLPGFIDTHVHAPQLDVIGSHGAQLLDWLNSYTFPAEARYADEPYAREGAAAFLDNLLDAGTTTAMIFATSHLRATDLLFAAAHARGMRVIAGKVLMDQNAMPALQDTAEGGINDSERLIKQWHGVGRLGYAITPRFAGSSSSAQLSGAARLHRKYPDAWVQTHLSESPDEIALVRKIYPDAPDYLNVYEQHGLVTERSVFAHCIHLTDAELERLVTQGGRVAFCPSSNLFLGSGLLDLQRLKEAGAVLSIATDVGAGTSLSMLRTLGDAYKVCQLQGYSLGAIEGLAMATLGNAEALHLDAQIGNLQPGKEADFVLLDPHSSDLLARRIDLTGNIEDELFVYFTLGDERTVAATYVAGELFSKQGSQA